MKYDRAYLAIAVAWLLGSCGDTGHDPSSGLIIRIDGLVGSRLTLENNGSNPAFMAPQANGPFAYVFGVLAPGTSYDVRVRTQPTTPSQTCTVSGGTGVIGAGSNEVSISCVTRPARFLYVAQSDGIGAFAIDPTNGMLTPLAVSPFQTPCIDETFLQLGRPATVNPWRIAVDPEGTFAMVLCPNDQILNYVATVLIDRSDGSLSPTSPPLHTSPHPYSLALHPAGHLAYVSFDRDGFAGFETASPSRTLTRLGAFSSGVHGAPLAIEPEGRFAYQIVGNEVVAFAIDAVTGALTPGSAAAAPQGVHFLPCWVTSCWSMGIDRLTQIVVDPSDSYVYVSLRDARVIVGYELDANHGVLSPLDGSPFAAPDAIDFLAVDPIGRFLFAVNTENNTISVYAIEHDTGKLRPIAGSPFQTGQTPLGAVIDPSGRFLYVANLGSRNISAYAISDADGSLTQLVGSPFPTHGSPASLAISN
jgi:6-phosphogluconolactonase